MVRLSRSDACGPGLSRRRCGRGFAYYDPLGELVVEAVHLARIRALAIPPAWRDVWICPSPTGHIQAVGVDAAGRRQYRYHDEWRRRRDQAKFERVLGLAERLPRLRGRVSRDLALPDLHRDRVLAALVRLLDLGTFRIGNVEYADEHNTFGLATLHRDHVRLRGDEMWFDYVAKGGLRRVEVVRDRAVGEVVRALRRRRTPEDPHLFAYRPARRWLRIRSDQVNEYLRLHSGLEITAKDFRTWRGTVLMALALTGQEHPVSRTGRDRVVRTCYVAVSERLGNTPAVARSSYVDPRVVDRYHEGMTLADFVSRPPSVPELWPGTAAARRPERRTESRTTARLVASRSVEQAVIHLITGCPPAVDRAQR